MRLDQCKLSVLLIDNTHSIMSSKESPGFKKKLGLFCLLFFRMSWIEKIPKYSYDRTMVAAWRNAAIKNAAVCSVKFTVFPSRSIHITD